MKPFDKEQKEWISDHYKAGMSFEELSLSTGRNIQRIKRSLADTKDLSLTWYKPAFEHELLEEMASIGIRTFEDFQEFIQE